ncbi:unnamed protein product [Leptosia nina]|uniref:Uncharacterized protein n=1 Tax=Leptosia nina TaxID=320188 RepID=A0AAV1J7T8_9NEOP
MKKIILLCLVLSVTTYIECGLIRDLFEKPIDKFYNMTEKIHKAKMDAIHSLDEKLVKVSHRVKSIFGGKVDDGEEKHNTIDDKQSEKIIDEKTVETAGCPEGSPGALNGSCLPEEYIRFGNDIEELKS